MSQADVRYGARWSRPQRIKNAGLYLAIRLALALAAQLPERLLAMICGLLARCVYWFVPAIRRRTRSNLELTLGEAAARDFAYAAFCSAGRNLALTLLLRRKRWRIADRVSLEAPSRALLDAALRRGKGVLFLSGHFGPFEWLPAAAQELGYPVSIVVRESYDPRLDRHVDAHRSRRGVQVIHRGRPDAVHDILRALAQGRIVGMLPDLAGRLASSRCEFFDATLDVARGAAVLARRSGAAVLFGGLQRRRTQSGSQDFSIQIQELTNDSPLLLPDFSRRLQQLILDKPADWPWMALSISCKK